MKCEAIHRLNGILCASVNVVARLKIESNVLKKFLAHAYTHTQYNLANIVLITDLRPIHYQLMRLMLSLSSKLKNIRVATVDAIELLEVFLYLFFLCIDTKCSLYLTETFVSLYVRRVVLMKFNAALIVKYTKTNTH